MSTSRFIWINLAVNSYVFCLTAGATTSAASAVSSNPCFFPSGGLASSYVPCSPNGDGQCCVDGDFCTQYGYCISNSKGYHYRGACTDSTWGNPSCPKYCLDNTNSGNSSAVNVIACDVAETDGSWCCAYDGNCCSTSSAVYTPGFGTIYAEGVAAAQTVFTSMVTVSATGAPTTVIATTTVTNTPVSIAAAGSSETSTPVTAARAKDNTPTVVGAAVGIPLGLAALVGFIFFYMERRKRIGAAAGWTDVKRGSSRSPTPGINEMHSSPGSQTQILSRQQYQQPPPPQQQMGFFAPDSNSPPKDISAYELSTARMYELGHQI